MKSTKSTKRMTKGLSRKAKTMDFLISVIEDDKTKQRVKITCALALMTVFSRKKKSVLPMNKPGGRAYGSVDKPYIGKKQLRAEAALDRSVGKGSKFGDLLNGSHRHQ